MPLSFLGLAGASPKTWAATLVVGDSVLNVPFLYSVHRYILDRAFSSYPKTSRIGHHARYVNPPANLLLHATVCFPSSSSSHQAYKKEKEGQKTHLPLPPLSSPHESSRGGIFRSKGYITASKAVLAVTHGGLNLGAIYLQGIYALYIYTIPIREVEEERKKDM